MAQNTTNIAIALATFGLGSGTPAIMMFMATGFVESGFGLEDNNFIKPLDFNLLSGYN